MYPIIELSEQFGFRKEERYIEVDNEQLSLLKEVNTHTITVKRKQKDEMCIRFDCVGDRMEFQASYFVGVDWLVESKQAVYVQPKENGEKVEVDYLKMLLDALQESENIKYLDELVTIDFQRPSIQINQSQDILSPFLIAQYLQLLKQIVRKGLKKSYYTITENLNAKVKGKILVGTNIKTNTVVGRATHTVCQYQEFGVNYEENKILKKAFLFSRAVLDQYKYSFSTNVLQEFISYISPAFEKVTDDIDINRVKHYKPNPLYKEYEQAIRLALLILKRFSYTITRTEDKQINTPPFWIDMSKLFELYVFSKLRKIFPGAGEVRYHIQKTQKQELDFLIKSADGHYKYVVDTKYKPRYEKHCVKVDDIRQLSGYARLKSVYDDLGYKGYTELLKCLVIYSHQDCDEVLTKEHFNIGTEADIKKIREENAYAEFYKLGVKLPEKLY
ncbi:MAG: hypothetical protein H6Q17_2002 [Bacteroidetes bacterium]|nr:hypothetical protein [Bacteroidota bacterium]